jgi:hypothetical protein
LDFIYFLGYDVSAARVRFLAAVKAHSTPIVEGFYWIQEFSEPQMIFRRKNLTTRRGRHELLYPGQNKQKLDIRENPSTIFSQTILTEGRDD